MNIGKDWRSSWRPCSSTIECHKTTHILRIFVQYCNPPLPLEQFLWLEYKVKYLECFGYIMMVCNLQGIPQPHNLLVDCSNSWAGSCACIQVNTRSPDIHLTPASAQYNIYIREHGSVSLCRDGQKTKWRLQCKYSVQLIQVRVWRQLDLLSGVAPMNTTDCSKTLSDEPGSGDITVTIRYTFTTYTP